MSAQARAQASATTVPGDTATPAKPATPSAKGARNAAAAAAVQDKAKAGGDTHGQATTPTVPEAQAEVKPPSAAQLAGSNEATSLLEAFTKGHFSGDFRTIYFSTHNAFFSPGVNQDTISYGGKLGFTTASLYGFTAGVSGFIQRGINHSDNPAKVDGYLGPNLLAMGEAYLQYEGHGFKIVGGNQQLDVPFASTYDWRMAPELFQGVSARYGDSNDFVQAFKMFRFKSYISDSFTKRTTYNSDFDSYSTIGNEETNGFWGVGAGHKWAFQPVTLTAQGWFQTYQDYAKLTYVEGQVIRSDGLIRPFVGLQAFRETGDGRDLLGNVNSEVWGAQFGIKRNSLTLSFGYNRIVPHADSYLNGALVTPYAHNVSSGPLFAQPFLSSTQDLGAGNAYAIDINGAPMGHWFIGARYSFMDLKSSATAVSLDQSEYLFYAIYNFTGKLKGLSIADFIALQSSPEKSARFIQNRLTLEYAFGG
ncbi:MULTISPECIES: OprD family outer membrane porin [unclassified Paraburkholderia]|uniref:OprD family outer membrane porin n=1 Tax=unclassified Paraburkholderia TaxID=2615204 RepID=UPI002AAFA71E|nr:MULTISPECIES: OprD family outer membrane porin [unclassified Paraburkholderia]